MKKAKEFNLLGKIRSTMRDIWRYSPSHRNALKAANHNGEFQCPLCAKTQTIYLATVDHIPPVGSFTLPELGEWAEKLFYGPTRVICKPCHKGVTAAQRRKK